MSGLLCDMLDYDNTDIFITPFGGMCRVLLNKPRHKTEIYNDSSKGLCTLLEVLAQPDKAKELMECLYNTEYTKVWFDWAVQFRNQNEDNWLQELIREMGKLLRSLDRKYNTKEKITKIVKLRKQEEIDNIEHLKATDTKEFNRQLRKINILYAVMAKEPKTFNDRLQKQIKEIYERAIKRDSVNIDELLKDIRVDNDDKNSIKHFIDEINKVIKHCLRSRNGVVLYDIKCAELEDTVNEKLQKWVKWYIKNKKPTDGEIDDEVLKNVAKRIYNGLCRDIFFDMAINDGSIPVDEIELAAATYIVYAMSRDGMGTHFSEVKYKTSEDYHRTIDKLYDCAERLRGVEVHKNDAMDFFLSKDTDAYINNPRVMMMCDPTYLKEGKQGDKEPNPLNEYNPGRAYKHYWTREEHMAFVKIMQLAKCKVMITNYDDSEHLYSEYLEGGKGLTDEEKEQYGWKPFKRLEYETVTTVPKGDDNTRTECIWTNY